MAITYILMGNLHFGLCPTASESRPCSDFCVAVAIPWPNQAAGICAAGIAACLIVCTLYVCLSVCLRVTVCHCPLLQFLTAGAWQGAARRSLCAAAAGGAHCPAPTPSDQHCRTWCRCQCSCTVIRHSPPRYRSTRQ